MSNSAARLPLNLQNTILSFVRASKPELRASSSPPAAVLTPPAPREQAQARHGAVERITNSADVLTPTDLFCLGDAAARNGSPCVVVKDGFLGRELAEEVHAAACQDEVSSLMRPAGMGRGLGLWRDTQSRGDHILWVTDGMRQEEKFPQVLELALARLSALGDELRAGGPALELNLVPTTSVQLACYPPGGQGYVRHLDAQRPVGLGGEGQGAGAVGNARQGPGIATGDARDGEMGRKITALYYLNPGWTPATGGCLRLHLKGNGSESPDQAGAGGEGEGAEQHGGATGAGLGGGGDTWDVEPLLDRLVLFRSDLVEHEVLPTQLQARWALTTWFYGRQSPAAAGPAGQLVPAPRVEPRVQAARPPPPPLPNLPAATAAPPAAGASSAADAAAAVDAAPPGVVASSGGIGAETGGVGGGESDTRAQVSPLPLPLEEEDLEGRRHAMDATIFVSVVSYRDSEAHPTVMDLFERAVRPDRVSVGLVWQLLLDDDGNSNSDGDNNVGSAAAAAVAAAAAAAAADKERNRLLRAVPIPARFRSRVRSIRMPHRDAAGPCWARRLAQSLWRGEVYVLQVDSHTRFRPGWDAFLVAELGRCPAAKPVLTTYPQGYELPHRVPVGETRPTLLCPDGFGEQDGMLRQRGRLLRRGPAAAPLPSPLWASGFSFSAAALLLEVPYDPGLRHAFFGEEVSMAARMFTRGWEFFAPSQAVAYHLWSRAYRPSFRLESTPETERERVGAERRLRRLLGATDGPDAANNADGAQEGHGSDDDDDDIDSDACFAFLDNFGLGSERTLEEFQERVGVDLRARRVTSPAAQDGGLQPEDFNDSAAKELAGALGKMGLGGLEGLLGL